MLPFIPLSQKESNKITKTWNMNNNHIEKINLLVTSDLRISEIKQADSINTWQVATCGKERTGLSPTQVWGSEGVIRRRCRYIMRVEHTWTSALYSRRCLETLCLCASRPTIEQQGGYMENYTHTRQSLVPVTNTEQQVLIAFRIS